MHAHMKRVIVHLPQGNGDQRSLHTHKGISTGVQEQKRKKADGDRCKRRKKRGRENGNN